MKYCFILFFTLFFLNARSNDSLLINKDYLFGLSWDSKIDEFKKKLGDPIGVIKLSGENTVYIWNGDFGLKFNKRNKLTKVFLFPMLLSYELSSNIEKVFKIEDITIGTDIKIGMSKESLEKKYGKNDKPSTLPNSEPYYKEINGLKFEIRFINLYLAGGKKETLVTSILITKE